MALGKTSDLPILHYTRSGSLPWIAFQFLSSSLIHPDDEVNPNKYDAEKKTNDAKDADKQACKDQSTQLPQPPQPPPSRRKTKVLLKKTKKLEAQADDDVILTRLTKLKKKVEALSMFNLPEAIDKSVQAHLKKTLPKDVPDFESKIRKIKDSDETSSKKSKDKDASSKEGKALSKSSKSNKAVDAEEIVQDDAMDVEQDNKDDFVDTQDDAAPTQDRSKWFKQDAVVRPETLDPEWSSKSHNLPVDFFFNKDLKCLKNENIETKYASSLTKPKAARIVLKKRVEDVQLRVESYQTKLKVIRPQVRCDGLDVKEPYTIMHEPRGVVYLNKNKGKYLLRADKLYKFNDGTLKPIWYLLNLMLHNFELGYNASMPKRAWIKKDQKRTTSILKKIEKMLLTRRIMRSLECFVGGRRIKTDF
uniref:Uncharacterized protein n=1 Tax=Tanacetum cinerariifolium TaxID=118510 RepID=A0A699HKY2_TANCI|nr:hypothetical protein [Tanacetum cinerariifolium]